MRTTIIALIVLTVALAGCLELKPASPTPKVDLAQGELKQFSSNADFQEFLLKAASSQNYGGVAMRGSLMSQTFAESAADSAGAPSAVPTAAKAEQYSQTNVQVEGVDEADIIKTDGKYIYTVSGNTVSIIDAYPAENAKIIAELDFKSTPRNIFVNEDKLVVFVDGNQEVMRIWEGDFMPRPYYTQLAQVFVYDISDKENPEKVQNYSVEGNYYDSRMIGDNVYFIANSYAQYDRPILPLITGSRIMAPEAFYFDYPDYSYSFYTVASFDVSEGPDSLNAKSYLLGQSTTLYVSENAIYLAARQTPGWGYYRQNNMDRFNQAVLPALPSDVRTKIDALGDDDSWNEISSILEDMYNSMSKQEQETQIKKISESIEAYERKLQEELSKTTIHKINIDDGEIEYSGKGQVSGYPLNQFSMDENDGYFRIATTTEFWTSKEQVQHNNVFVLDSGMNVVGKLESLAKGERIYSARFIGDRLYLVTFKRIDPLFVIDLSQPSSPTVLGELKIPGYSDYLHPYDEDHIIGLGRNTKDTEWGGVTATGLKLALFDVSDVNNPVQQAAFFINGSSTYSEALNDHKAFLFDKEKNLLVIPVQEVLQEGNYDQRVGIWRPQKVWQGAYVFGLTPEDGFEVKGKVVHFEGEEQTDYYYYDHGIRRSLYIDNVLYTLSARKLQANDLNDLSNELASIKLPDYPAVYGEVVPMGTSGGGSVGIVKPTEVRPMGITSVVTE